MKYIIAAGGIKAKVSWNGGNGNTGGGSFDTDPSKME
jgi:hypothetical protein